MYPLTALERTVSLVTALFLAFLVLDATLEISVWLSIVAYLGVYLFAHNVLNMMLFVVKNGGGLPPQV